LILSDRTIKAAEAVMTRVITLTTDFGTRDAYVGAMKGVIYSLAPRALVVDITHEIQPGNVEGAAFVLESFHTYFPGGTIHLVVVDPGVGSSRRALAVESDRRIYVGPDNGVFEPVFRSEAGFICYELTDSKFHLETISHTFHGRDIFAPVAAHLATGARPESLGPQVHDPVRLVKERRETAGRGYLTARVVHADRFGNLVTDITARELAALGAENSALEVSICGVKIEGISDYYVQAPPGELLALIGSTGRLEIAACGRSAAEILGPESVNAALTITKFRG